MKRILSCVLVSVFLISGLLAQEEELLNENNGHHLGLFAGPSSGYGLSYRYFKDKVGLQITTTPIFSKNDTHLSLGGLFLTSFTRTKYTNFYGYLGYHYNYNKYSYDDYYYSEDDINNTHIAGLGVGFELVAGNRVSFNWQLGYGFYYFDKDDWQTMIDGGFGIFYKF